MLPSSELSAVPRPRLTSSSASSLSPAVLVTKFPPFNRAKIKKTSMMGFRRRVNLWGRRKRRLSFLSGIFFCSFSHKLFGVVQLGRDMIPLILGAGFYYYQGLSHRDNYKNQHHADMDLRVGEAAMITTGSPQCINLRYQGTKTRQTVHTHITLC